MSIQFHYNNLDDSFVGIKNIENSFHIYFPRGFSSDDAYTRKDVLSLLHILKRKSLSNKVSISSKENGFPLESYLYIIRDFLKNGYFQVKDTQKCNETRGKINWKDTIRKHKPHIVDNGFFFSTFVVEKKISHQNSLISLIYKKCLSEAVSKIGFLFGNIQNPPMEQRVTITEAISVTSKILQRSFSDEKKTLFQHILNILKSIGNSETGKANETLFGTDTFAPVWEYLVDRKFGDKDLQKEYHPRAEWHLLENSSYTTPAPLRLDSIHINGDIAYILDSKYYKYGVTLRTEDLPGTESVAKQIIYGDEVKKRHKGELKKIYNAFIIPADNGIETPYKYLGYATSTWKNSDDEDFHNSVWLISVDSRFLLYNYDNNSVQEKQDLMDLIKGRADNILSINFGQRRT